MTDEDDGRGEREDADPVYREVKVIIREYARSEFPVPRSTRAIIERLTDALLASRTEPPPT